MLTRDDLIDLIIDAVRRQRPAVPPSSLGAPAAAASVPAKANKEEPQPRGRLFLSEYDIKKRLTPGGRRLTIPKDAILSPLAADWLVLQGIEIVRE